MPTKKLHGDQPRSFLAASKTLGLSNKLGSDQQAESIKSWS